MKRTCHGNNIQGGGTKGYVNLVEKAIFMARSSTCTHLNFNKLTTIFTCEIAMCVEPAQTRNEQMAIPSVVLFD